MSSQGDKWLTKMLKNKGEWFDYSNTQYVAAKEKVIVRCKVCGNSFKQTPDSHGRRVGKKGCPYCAGKMHTTESIKRKITDIHGDKYGLDKVHFISTKDKVTLVCKVHGEFSAILNNVLSKGTGCIKCAEAANGRACRTTVTEFMEYVKKRFDAKYTYPQLEFESIQETIRIICPIHGEFTQIARDHMHSAAGCPQCGVISTANKLRSNVDEFVVKANKIHKGYYTYTDVIYLTNRSKVIITCPVHGSFEQTPNDHLEGKGCQICANYGFKEYLPARLYYLRVDYGPFKAYKIGITNKEVEERWVKDLDRVTIIKIWDYPRGKDARKEERRILNDFKVYKWTGIDLLKSGNTELFDRDVLELDNG